MLAHTNSVASACSVGTGSGALRRRRAAAASYSRLGDHSTRGGGAWQRGAGRCRGRRRGAGPPHSRRTRRARERGREGERGRGREGERARQDWESSRTCLGSASEVPRRCRRGASEVSRKCPAPRRRAPPAARRVRPLACQAVRAPSPTARTSPRPSPRPSPPARRSGSPAAAGRAPMLLTTRSSFGGLHDPRAKSGWPRAYCQVPEAGSETGFERRLEAATSPAPRPPPAQKTKQRPPRPPPALAPPPPPPRRPSRAGAR